MPKRRRTIMAKKKKNTGVPYDRLVQGIFQAIHDQEEVATIDVEQNRTLQGKTVPHDVDVYWKFEKGGIVYETIVQAKDWQSPVKKGQLIEFKGVLDDLPGQVRGVFVTRTGYQKGAKDFSAANKIILYELGELPPKKNVALTTLGWLIAKADIRSFSIPTNNPEEKPVEEVAMGINLTVFNPRFSNLVFEIDGTSLRQNVPASERDNGKFKLYTLPFLETILYDENHASVGNLDATVRKELAIMKGEKLDRKHVVHVFDPDTFLGPPSTTGGYFVKTNKVSFDVEIEVAERPPHFNLTKFVQLVLRAKGGRLGDAARKNNIRVDECNRCFRQLPRCHSRVMQKKSGPDIGSIYLTNSFCFYIPPPNCLKPTADARLIPFGRSAPLPAST
jgi:Restriction endonuclease